MLPTWPPRSMVPSSVGITGAWRAAAFARIRCAAMLSASIATAWPRKAADRTWRGVVRVLVVTSCMTDPSQSPRHRRNCRVVLDPVRAEAILLIHCPKVSPIPKANTPGPDMSAIFTSGLAR